MENLTAKEFCGKVFNSCVKHLTIICMHCWNVNKSCSGLLFYQHPVHIFLSPDISRKSAWVWESAVRCSCLFKFSLLFAKTAFWWYIYRIYSCISRPAYKPVAAIGDERVPWICALSPRAACANPDYGTARRRPPMSPPAAMQAAALVCRHSSSSLRVVLVRGRWQVPTNGPCRANSRLLCYDPRISRPPKLYRQNSAENCRLIREYIRYLSSSSSSSSTNSW